LRIGSGQLHASTQSFPEPCILEARDPQASGSAQAKSSSLAQASRLLTLRLKRSAIFFLQLMGQSRRMFLFSRSLFAPLPPGVLSGASDPQIFPPHIPTRIANLLQLEESEKRVAGATLRVAATGQPPAVFCTLGLHPFCMPAPRRPTAASRRCTRITRPPTRNHTLCCATADCPEGLLRPY
jgi:hypothetical protein